MIRRTPTDLPTKMFIVCIVIKNNYRTKAGNHTSHVPMFYDHTDLD